MMGMSPISSGVVVSLAESLDILFEDNHCLVLNKPAGWPTTHFDGREETVDQLAKSYIREKYGKAGEVFLGIVHRLDKPVSGALLFARTSKSAARLSAHFRDGAIEKVYWAVVDAEFPRGALGSSSGSALAGTIEDWLLHDDESARVRVVRADTPKSKHAFLHYQVLRRDRGLTFLELRPQTGRKHQLRVQLASRGAPIWGDTKYGSPHVFGHGIALHARSLSFLHPTRDEEIAVTAEVPPLWKSRFARLLTPEADK
jgi:23S rRNA pseudouridine1911/1915/1917 synthase